MGSSVSLFSLTRRSGLLCGQTYSPKLCQEHEQEQEQEQEQEHDQEQKQEQEQEQEQEQ